VSEDVWTVKDKVSGFSDFAILRWRLCKSKWTIKDNQLISEVASIYIEGVDKDKLKLTKGFESLYYNEVSEIDVFEARIEKPCTVVTRITLFDKVA